RALAAEAQARTHLGKAQAEEAKARTSAAEARAVLEFFQSKVLAAARPKDDAGGLSRDATIRAALDAAEPEIAGAFRDQATVEASIRNALGETYFYLGEPALAIVQHERARALFASALDADDPGALSNTENLASAYWAAGRTADAITLREQVLP